MGKVNYMTLEEKISELDIEAVAKQYEMPIDKARTKYLEIKDYLKETQPGRSHEFYDLASVARLRNFARAYRDQGGWEG